MSNIKKKGKDYTKYEFQGKLYGKSGLVLAVVKKYLVENPSANLETIKQAFPRKEFKSTFEVVESSRKAKAGRFFLNKADRIKVANGFIAVTNQWTKDRIDPFINFVEKNFGFSIKKTKGNKTMIA